MREVYETERLLLKLPDTDFSAAALDYYIRNRSFFKKWDPVRDELFYTQEYQTELLKNDRRCIENGTMFKLWMFKRESPERIIGSAAFSNIVRGPFLSCFLGYRSDKEEVNKGYVTEAVRKGIEVVFNELGLHRIEANIMPENKASLRAAEKLGFRNEGLSVRYLKINGKWEDHIHMVLLNESI
jgi:ribosomal-protein-alanine N-acetyltransferase